MRTDVVICFFPGPCLRLVLVSGTGLGELIWIDQETIEVCWVDGGAIFDEQGANGVRWVGDGKTECEWKCWVEKTFCPLENSQSNSSPEILRSTSGSSSSVVYPSPTGRISLPKLVWLSSRSFRFTPKKTFSCKALDGKDGLRDISSKSLTASSSDWENCWYYCVLISSDCSSIVTRSGCPDSAI